MRCMALFSGCEVSPGFIGGEEGFATEDPAGCIMPFAVDEETSVDSAVVFVRGGIVGGLSAGCGPGFFCSGYVGVID